MENEKDSKEKKSKIFEQKIIFSNVDQSLQILSGRHRN